MAISIFKLVIQLIDKANYHQGINIGAPSLSPMCVWQSDHSMMGEDSIRHFNPSVERFTAHFMGIKTGEDGVTRPDMMRFYVMRSNPIRTLYKEVKDQVRLDSLDELINLTRKLVLDQ